MKNSSHFQMPSEVAVYINASFSALITGIALPANIIIIFIFARFKKLRDMNNTAVTILSLSDLLRVSVVMTLKLHNQLLFVTHLQATLCTLSALVCGFTFVFSPMILALIAIVRYCKIVPWTYRNIELTYTKFYSAVIFLLVTAILFSLLPMFGVGHYAYSQSHGVCFTDWSDENKAFRTIFYLLVIGLAFPVLITCYSLLFIALHKHNNGFTKRMGTGYIPAEKLFDVKCANENKAFEHNGCANPENQSNSTDLKQPHATENRSGRRISILHAFTDITKKSKKAYKNYDLQTKGCIAENEAAVIAKIADQRGSCDNQKVSPSSSEANLYKNRIVKHIFKQELQITKVMMVICLAYCVCWLPAALVNVIALSHLEKIPQIWFYIIVTMVELKCALNPIIYGLGNRKYREELKRIVRMYSQRRVR